ncbi:MAG: M4 family metallopeptidase [Patescibacteria group bacterium]
MSKPFLVLTISCSLLAATSVSAQYELSAISTTTDSLNTEHITYQQYYQGVPVFGGQLKLHTTTTPHQRIITGQTTQASEIDVVPTVSADAASNIAITLSGQTAPTVLKNNLYVFNEHILNKQAPDQNVLVWQIELFKDKDNTIFHKFYFIDAHIGTIVFQIDGLQDAIDRRIWDCSYGLTGDCYLDELDISTGYYYGRSEGQPARGPNPLNPNFLLTYLSDTDNLYTNLGNIYNYYLATFARAGANGNGGMGDGSSAAFATTATVGLTYIDYYFLSESDSGSCPNAFFDGARAMHYCEGFITNDISGHEYAHAVNYFSVLDSSGAAAGLTYTNESGALNEASSDVFGEALEYYVTGSNDWVLGEGSPLGIMRSMIDPTDYNYTGDSGSVPYPDRHNSANLYCGTEDSGGVHINSSVINKAAYLMAMGGTFNTCTITGIGRAKEEAIFYRAQSTYYTTSTDFNGAYTALLAACHDLYSVTDCKEVEKALRATELNQAGSCSAEPAVDPGCLAVDTAPTITDVTSTVADGSYKAGDIIDIAVTFSEAVSGTATVTLETGTTDQTCTFTASAETTGTCDYTVQAGDVSADLTVLSITGTITDESGDAITTTLPTTNLAANKAIVIDTAAPKIPTKLRIYASPQKHKLIKSINPQTYTKVIKAKSMKPYFQWPAVTGVTKYYAKFTHTTMSRSQLLHSTNLRTNRSLRGKITNSTKKYYLYMLLEDAAGNQSRVKTLMRYKIRT